MFLFIYLILNNNNNIMIFTINLIEHFHQIFIFSKCNLIIIFIFNLIVFQILFVMFILINFFIQNVLHANLIVYINY